MVSGYQWTGFVDEGSLFVDWGALDGVNSFAKISLVTTQVAAIYWASPSRQSRPIAACGDKRKQSSIIPALMRILAPTFVINAPLNAIREVEFDGVRLNGPGGANTPAINIQGVQLLTVNAWVGYDATNVNSAITLANVGTAYLRRFTARADAQVITAASTVGTLILEDCVYTTLNSSASVTIVTQQGQIAPPTYTVATLPAASAANKGFRANVSDQLTSLPAFGGALTGGGALLSLSEQRIGLGGWVIIFAAMIRELGNYAGITVT